jgi:hypothetical protein
LCVDIDTGAIKPGTIYDDIEEYITDNNLKKQWAIDEQDDEADDIMDSDDKEEAKPRHIRLTIKAD